MIEINEINNSDCADGRSPVKMQGIIVQGL